MVVAVVVVHMGDGIPVREEGGRRMSVGAMWVLSKV